MSTYYRPMRPIQITKLFDGSLEKFGVSESPEQDSSNSHRCLTDGESFLWVGVDSTRSSVGFTRYGSNAVGGILSAVSGVFDTKIAEEYDPQFWGFETQEEWDACEQKITEERDAIFYVEMMKHVRCEPNNLREGSVGMIEAEIAKNLIADRPSLGSPEKKRELLDAISKTYD